MPGNVTAIDSLIYGETFSTAAMRSVWSDETRIQSYLDVEKALSLARESTQPVWLEEFEWMRCGRESRSTIIART